MSDNEKDEKTEEEFEQTIDALRALIGGSPVARTVVKADKIMKESNVEDFKKAKKEVVKNVISQQQKDLQTSTDEVYTNFDTLEKVRIPKANKTLQAGDFLRLKKHNSTQAQAMLQAFVKKHGKIRPDSKELHVLVNALAKILKR